MDIDSPPDSWMTPLINYLTSGTLHSDKEEVRRVRFKSSKYVLIDGTLYKRSYAHPLLKCIDEEQARYVLAEVHEGICGDHTGGRTLGMKIMRQGYYWPTIQHDATEYARKCEACQRIAPIPRQPPETLTSMSLPWPFAQWGIDFIGPLPKGVHQAKFAIVAVDYFTKWAEAEPLATITAAKTENFIWKSIICRFGIPHTIISDNGKQFDSERFRTFCNKYGIRHLKSTPYHPQANGQVEAVNKIIKRILKAKLEGQRAAWAGELPNILWAYRTTPRTSTKESPFALAYGTEAVVPVEIGLPSYRTENFDPQTNEESMRVHLDHLEERRDKASMRTQEYKRRVERHYNSRVKIRRFKEGDLVLKRIHPPPAALGQTWSGPFKVIGHFANGAYRLEDLNGNSQDKPCNAEHLRRYYQ